MSSVNYAARMSFRSRNLAQSQISTPQLGNFRLGSYNMVEAGGMDHERLFLIYIMF